MATTPNYGLYQSTFDERFWHDRMNNNLSIIDATLAKFIGTYNIVGVWENSTAYTVGQVVVDEISGLLYECDVAHTSPATPTTFTTALANNPAYWTLFSLPARLRGAWTEATAYELGDFIVHEAIYAVCILAHTSGSTFAGDSANWEYLVDATDLSSAQVTATGSTTARTLAARFAGIGDVSDFGAVGDGVTDDSAAFIAALAAYDRVVAPPGVYLVKNIVVSTHQVLDCQHAILKIASSANYGVKLTGYAPVFKNAVIKDESGGVVTQTTLSSGAAGTDTTISVTSATGFSVRQPVFIRLDDGAQHCTRVTAVVGTTITLKDALPSAAASGNAVITGSASVVVENECTWFRVSDLHFVNNYVCLLMRAGAGASAGSGKGIVENIRIGADLVCAGIIHQADIYDVRVRDVQVWGGASGNDTGAGVIVDTRDAQYSLNSGSGYSAVQALTCNTGFQLQGVNGTSFTDCFADTCTGDGWLLDACDKIFINNGASTYNYYGMRVKGSCLDVHIRGWYTRLHGTYNPTPANARDFIIESGSSVYLASLMGNSSFTNTVSGALYRSNSQTIIESGTASAPGIIFRTDTNTGVFSDAADFLGFSSGGSARGGVYTSGMLTGDGSAATPGLAFLGDQNTGLYRPAADSIGFSVGGVLKHRIQSDGRWEASAAIRNVNYTIATLPSASGSGVGAYAYVTDESGGAVGAESDGTNWRRVTDRAVVGSSAGPVLPSLQVDGNTTLGDASGDSVTINAGTVSAPNIPAVNAYVTAELANVTGDGTNYTVIFGTERFDQRADYDNTTGVFTAPNTGKYLISTAVTMRGMSSNNTRSTLAITTSSQTYTVEGDPYTSRNSDGRYTAVLTVVADMASAETAYVALNVQATDKVVDVQTASYLSIAQIA